MNCPRHDVGSYPPISAHLDLFFSPASCPAWLRHPGEQASLVHRDLQHEYCFSGLKEGRARPPESATTPGPCPVEVVCIRLQIPAPRISWETPENNRWQVCIFAANRRFLAVIQPPKITHSLAWPRRSSPPHRLSARACLARVSTRKCQLARGDSAPPRPLRSKGAASPLHPRLAQPPTISVP